MHFISGMHGISTMHYISTYAVHAALILTIAVHMCLQYRQKTISDEEEQKT